MFPEETLCGSKFLLEIDKNFVSQGNALGIEVHNNVIETGITSPGCVPAHRKYLVTEKESAEEREIHSLT